MVGVIAFYLLSIFVGVWLSDPSNLSFLSNIDSETKVESSNNTQLQNEITNNTQVPNDLEFLSESNGKYPSDIKLFDNDIFKTRLVGLIGEKYNSLIEKWNTEYPIEVSDNNVFVATANETQNSVLTCFILVFDITNNILYVGMKEDGEIQLYSESGKTCQQLDVWESQNRNQ